MALKYNTARPCFHEDDIDYILDEFRDLLAGGGLLSMGRHVKEFEFQFAEYIGVEHAIATSSCTAALETILAAAGIGPGDEVIIPVQTFIASASSIMRVGARPVFAEINGQFLLDFDDLKSRVTPKTKAVITVHFAGLIDEHIFEMKTWLNAKGILLVEDSAHAHGASLSGVKAGNIGNAGAFSFYATKNMTTGEGGMITSNDKEFSMKCASIRSRGVDLKADSEQFNELGGNFRMTEVQALMGKAQLRRLDEFVKHRQGISKVYDESLMDSGGGLVQPIKYNRETIVHAYWRYVVFLADRHDRNKIRQEMANQSIKVDWPYYPLVHLQPIIKKVYGIDSGYRSFSENLAGSHICLPMHLGISPEDAHYISRSLIKSL